MNSQPVFTHLETHFRLFCQRIKNTRVCKEKLSEEKLINFNDLTQLYFFKITHKSKLLLNII